MSPDVTEQVALVTGRILHAGTGQAILGRLRINTRGGLLSERERLISDKVLKDGTFVLSGQPELLFPNLLLQDYTLNLIIRAESTQFRRGVVEQPLVVLIPPGSAFDQPVPAGTIHLPADPVNIRGRVVEAKNPQTPIAGAKVEVLQSGAAIPPATTDPGGKYRFDEIAISTPTQIGSLAPHVQIRCSAAGFKPEKRTLLIDFGRLMNEENFRLPPL